MKIKEKLRGAMRRVAGVSSVPAVAEDKRRTLGVPSILNSYGYARAGAAWSSGIPKPTPANLRRFSETPVARKVINTIKDRIAGMRWTVQARRGRSLEQLADGVERVQILTETFESPNPDDSFRSFAEQVLEDIIVGGFGAIEVQSTGIPDRPLALW